MIPKKKLQVFVSSTYVDLKEERQAAVEAILNAGHIPAGMELFAAGDQSQMEVIRRWIDESDVYLLILGGRYGSIEPESGKSYIHLEYEYAIEKGKPHFALVITDKGLDDKVEKDKRLVLEQDNNKELKAFKQFVTEKKVVRFWNDVRDIKYFILESLNEFEKREDLIGWIKGDQAVNSGEIAEQLARLLKENAELREKLANQSKGEAIFNGFTYKEMYDLISMRSINEEIFGSKVVDRLSLIAKEFGDSNINLVHAIWDVKDYVFQGKVIGGYELAIVKLMNEFGFISDLQKASSSGLYRPYYSEIGRAFVLKLMYERNNNLSLE